jgi:putative peptidoglycan lipid II flippase
MSCAFGPTSRGRSLLLVAGAASTIALSFASQWYLLATLGAGIESDAFYAASALPQLTNAVFCDPLVFVVVPLLAKSQPSTFWNDAWTIIHGITVLFVFIAIAVYLVCPFAMGLILPGFGPTGLTLAIGLAKILICGTLLAAIGAAARSVAHASGSLLWPTLCSAVGALAGLLWLLWSLPRIGIAAGAWAMTLRMAVETVLLLGGLRHYALPNPKSDILHGILTPAWPLWLGNLYYRSDIVLDRFLSSTAPPGVMSLFLLAQQVVGAISQVLNRGAAAPLLPRLARMAQGGNWVLFKKTYTIYLHRISICLGVLLLVLLVVGRQSLLFVFHFGSVSPSNVVVLWLLLLLLSGLLVGDPMSHIYSSAFYATGNTRTPTRVTAVAYTLGVAMKLCGARLAGVYGLAIATSGAFAVRTWLLARALRATMASETSTSGHQGDWVQPHVSATVAP